MNNYLLGKYIREKRESLGMSLRDFGKMCEISHTTIDCIEKGYDPRTGKEINITNNTFGKLSQALNVPVAKLVELSQGKEETPAGEGGRKVSDDELMFGLWGDSADVDEEDLADVKRYAQFVRERKKERGK